MDISVIILAAGLSKRMKAQKALLPLANLSAIEKLIESAKIANLHNIFIVTGHNSHNLKKFINANNVKEIHNPNYEKGMFSSITTALKTLPDNLEGTFIIPCDICAIKPNTFTTLIQAFIQSDKKKALIPTVENKNGHPIIIPKSLFSDIINYNGNEGLKGFFKTKERLKLPITDKATIMDMDTPQDYETLLNYLNLPSIPSEKDAMALFKKRETPSQIIQHCKAVATLAATLPDILNKANHNINTKKLNAAALVHDIGKPGRNHAEKGAIFLLQSGYPGIFDLVAGHMSVPENIATPELNTESTLFLADKLIRNGKITPINDTISAQKIRFKNDPEAIENMLKRMDYAKQLLTICNLKIENGKLIPI